MVDSDQKAERAASGAGTAALEGGKAKGGNNEQTDIDARELYRTAPVGLCLVDSELRYVHVNELLAKMNGKPVAEHIGRTLFEVIPGVAELIAPIFRRVLETGESVTSAEVDGRMPGAPYDRHTYLVTYQPFRSADGEIAGVSTVIEDVTELKRVERELRLTVRELDHRVKNTLATVHSLALQTNRSSASLDEFMRAYCGRIEALTRMHGPLSGSASERLPLSELLELVVMPLCSAADRISIEGDDPLVSSQSVRPLGLTLHELATNAIKFGALSNATGRVTVSARLERRDGHHQARISWVETNGPEAAPPQRRGFGTVLITEALPYELDATVTLEIPPSGARFEMLLPLRNDAV